MADIGSVYTPRTSVYPLSVLIGARALVGAASGGVPGALVLLADEHSGAARAREQAALIAVQ